MDANESARQTGSNDTNLDHQRSTDHGPDPTQYGRTQYGVRTTNRFVTLIILRVWDSLSTEHESCYTTYKILE